MGRLRNRYLFLSDIILCFLAYCLAIVAVSPASEFTKFITGGVSIIAIAAAMYLLSMHICKLYNIDWVYAGVRDYALLFFSCILAFFANCVIELLVESEFIFLKNNLIGNFFATVFICGSRFCVRIVYDLVFFSHKERSKRVLIIGAGTLGISLIRNIHNNAKLDYNIVGLIDDDKEKQGMRIHGVHVIGRCRDIINICEKRHIDEIIFAINSIDSGKRAEILDICARTGKKVKILPATEVVLNTPNKIDRIREVNVEDLLERDPISLDNELIKTEILGKTVLVTGGGGSIGSELCRQILKFNPDRLVILDIYENTTYEVQHELSRIFPEQRVDVVIGSVRDINRLEEIFEKYRPELIFHAAAHKHVPLMESSPAEAIKNNVFGTYNTAVCAKKYGVKKFVMISTDKAVNPTNVMGATKRLCERIVQTLQKTGDTEYVAVRFGNVLGSHGSVIPLFKKQIDEGGPVTVTHPDITRFFMTIPEAAQLVLQAATYAHGGEIFVLDMGNPVKIYDLAYKMITISGYVPEKDIEIKFTGLRPGEKLYEELLMDEEGLCKTSHSKIFVGKPGDMTLDELESKLEKLKTVLDSDAETIKKVLAEVVPTYKRSV